MKTKVKLKLYTSRSRGVSDRQVMLPSSLFASAPVFLLHLPIPCFFCISCHNGPGPLSSRARESPRAFAQWSYIGAAYPVSSCSITSSSSNQSGSHIILSVPCCGLDHQLIPAVSAGQSQLSRRIKLDSLEYYIQSPCAVCRVFYSDRVVHWARNMGFAFCWFVSSAL